ncbi:hypothetical protein [Shewanella sedimentimangrovi]|uniref:Uncharacterized protein n=1 Tax=Shewanella sedimentimangrovi TaxID=2814293 RepID=A0ABX7QY87_9GAMM|nr:hypothetical protein [Shewanella sedimentimangrovi]QSX36494.1 hypothetical protein JYB85_14555 [Shewanella sedimentimangrovi]
MEDTDDLETWIIELGDEIIHKAHSAGALSLSPAESAIYDFWAVDYAVRNAGNMDILEDLRPAAAVNLAQYLRGIGYLELASYMDGLSSAGDQCDSYYLRFKRLCEALQGALSRA